MMSIGEARSFIGTHVHLRWVDRKGEEMSGDTFIHKADFVPLYGPCLITDLGDIRLDRVVGCSASEQAKAA